MNSITFRHSGDGSPPSAKVWEGHLDDLDPKRRAAAVEAFRAAAGTEAAAVAADRPGNLHSHTFYSFNCHGYSPTRYALLARRYGMEVAGIVDFDVLDGLAEFHDAGRRLNLRTVVSLESRVCVPEFASRVINSPGEPGVAYHMAVGFAAPPAHLNDALFLKDLAKRSAHRNRVLVAKVNEYLAPCAIAYESDVLPLTPAGNATERHIVLAYARAAARRFGAADLLAFWTARLGPGLAPEDLPESPKLLNLLRARTMKQGGPGYVKPDAASFPRLADFNAFARACGALPTVAWLDGTSAGEQAMEEYCATAAASGACALNIIPDRNFTPGVKDQKLQNLHDVVALAGRLHWPVLAGTEMNSPGQRFVDRFDTAELAPLVPVFQRGARIVYAHTALQRAGGRGYLSDWAARHLPERPARNAFYEELGRRLTPAREETLRRADGTPADLLRELA